MRKTLIVIVILIFCISCLTGCDSSEYSRVLQENKNEMSMFRRVERAGQWDIVYDTETKVMYSSHGRGLIPLFEADGSLKKWKGQ